MKIGVVFPQNEIGTDVGAMKAYAQAAEALGFDNLHSADHIVGLDRKAHPDYKGPWGNTEQCVEQFIFFSFMGAITSRIEFVGGIILLTQRQTVLTAKQAASIDFVTNGRLRLCIGVGSNPVEFEAAGANFHDRGKRSEEQVAVLRALWCNPSVTFDGRWHKLNGVGINPLPVQRPIPLWFGGHDERVLERIGRIGDGLLLAREKPSEQLAQVFERVRGYAKKAGRDSQTLGFEGRVSMIGGGNDDTLLKETYAWKEFGATHAVLMTTFANLKTADQHINAMRRYKENLGPV